MSTSRTNEDVDFSAQVDRAVVTFLQILRSGWEGVATLAKTTKQEVVAEMLSDWAQSNWEMVVEAAISTPAMVFLDPYGDGAEANGASSRIWMPEAKPTHAIHIVSRMRAAVLWDVLSEANRTLPREGFAIDRFVTRSVDGWYEEKPPFDHVLSYIDGSEALFRVEDLEFVVQRTQT